MPVQRAHELMEWVKSGDYDRIAGGSYQRRDEPPRAAREEASDAVEHYTTRFKDAFSQAGESVEQLGQQLGDWLRRSRDDEDDQ